MTIRTRKFFGMIALVGFILAYAIGVMALAIDGIGDMPKLVEIVFYVIAGFAWIFPARYILRWMQRPVSGDV